jgi:hypothetical protein
MNTMADEVLPEGPPDAYKALVAAILEGPIPVGPEFDAAREIVRAKPESAVSFQAMCILLEGALGDASYPSDDTQVLVPLLKELARGTIAVQDLL